MSVAFEEQGQLILASEECPQELFERFHKFSSYDEQIIRKLIAHGPILLRGGRGSGKSALLLEANNRINTGSTNVFSVYLSLRYLPLLRSKGEQYENIFCELLIGSINQKLSALGLNTITLSASPSVGTVQQELVTLSSRLSKRIVLFFDDAAHLGRETALTEFFDIFRTISSSSVSCKAAIYPGVTKFGIRFDVFNDATVIDITRDERLEYFTKFFTDVIGARAATLLSKTSRAFPEGNLPYFLGRSVVGNMRAFVFACNKLHDVQRIGFPELTDMLLSLSADYYWPLLEELTPKLGIYEVMIEPSRLIAEKLFSFAGQSKATSVIIHRDIIQKYSKPIEILEYAGFISRREASRSMKSGGRGSRYSLNLCNLLENYPGRRITSDIFESWVKEKVDPAEIHASSSTLEVAMPELPEDHGLTILTYDIEQLKVSKAYPYGLTDKRITVLRENDINTVGDLADASNNKLLSLDTIGEKYLQRIRNVIGQAIWM